ncbi:TraA family conjugative transfer protein [Thiomonas sp.]
MRISSLFSKRGLQLAALASGLGAAAPAMAAQNTADPFYTFSNTVQEWAAGPLGVGLAVTMLLVGAGIGVAKNSPLPALSGVAGAAFLHWGPTVITTMMGAGAVI